MAAASERLVIIADASQAGGQLGAFPLPVEVVRFGHVATCNMIRDLAEETRLLGPISSCAGSAGRPAVRDRQRQLHLSTAPSVLIEDPELLDEALKMIPGVVENGMFLGLADVAILAGPAGVTVLEADWTEGVDE